jgi:hypothetical protein
LLNKGNVNHWIGLLLLKNGEVARKELYWQLFSIQNQSLVPIAPFTIKDGFPESKMVDIVISEMVSLGYIGQSGAKLSLTRKGHDLLKSGKSGELEKPQSVTPSMFSFPRSAKMAAKETIFKAACIIPLEVHDFSQTLYPSPEIGAIFSIHQNNSVFKSAIPLVQGDESQYCLFTEKPQDHLAIEDFNKNLDRIKSIAHNTLSDLFREDTILKTLEVIFYSLLPISAVRVEVMCGKKHVNRNYYRNYEEAILLKMERRCPKEDCFSPIKYTAYSVSNEKIFRGWRGGSLMEWFAAATLSKTSGSPALWSVEMLGVQCDAISIDGSETTVVECKRTSSYDSAYQEGVKQLETIRAALKEVGFKVNTIMLTTIAGPPINDQRIDAVVTQENYIDFCKDPYSLLR